MVERIGLQATMDMGQFNAGMNQYMKAMSTMTSATMGAAKALQSSFGGATNNFNSQMHEMGAVAQKTGGIMQTALGMALGNQITGALNAIGGAIKNTVGQFLDFGKAYDVVGQYEMLSQTLGSMVAMEERRNTAVEKTIGTTTTRIALTEKETKALAAAQENQRKYNNDVILAEEKLRKAAEGGKVSAAALDNMSIAVEKARAKAQGAANTIAELSGKEGRLVTSTKTATEYTLTMEQAMAKTSTQTQALIKWAKDLALWSPFGDQDVTGALQMSMALGATTTEAKRQTQALMDWAAATGKGGDVIGRMIVNLGQMKAAGKIYGGELRQMAYMGFPIRDILSKELGVSASQMDNLAEAGLDMSKVMEAIMHSLEKDYGGMARKMGGTFSGMKESLDTLMTESTRLLWTGIFDAIKPIMLEVINILTDPKVTEAISAIGNKIGFFAKGVIEPAWSMLKQIIPLLGPLFQYLGSGDTSALENLTLGVLRLKGGGDVLRTFYSVVTTVREAIVLASGAFNVFAGAIGFLVSGSYEGGLKRFIDGLSGLGVSAENFGAVIDVLRTAREIIVKFISGIGEAVKLLGKGDLFGAFGKVFETLRSTAEDIVQAIDWDKIWTAVKSAALTAIGKISDFAAEAWPKIKAWFEKTATEVSNKVKEVDWKAVWDKVRTALTDVAGTVGDFATKAWEKIKAWFTATATEVGNKVGDVDWSGVWQKVKEALATAVSKVSDAATTLGEKIAAWFEASKPEAQRIITGMDMTGVAEATRARVTAAVTAAKIEDLGLAISNWIIRASTWVSENLAPAIEGFAATLTKMAENMGTEQANEQSPIAQAIGNAFISIMKAAWGLLTNADLWEALWKVVVAALALSEANKTRIAEKVNEVGMSIVEGIVSGIETKAGEVADTIVAWVEDNIINIVKEAIGFGSPAKVFITLGESIGAGMAIGIEASSEKALSAVLGMTDSIINLVQGMIEAINSMATAPDTTNLKSWGTALSDLITTMMSTLTGFYDAPGGPKANAVDLTRRLAKSFNEVIAFVADMADAFGALAEVDLSKVTVAKISEFMARTHDILVAIVDEAAKWGKTELEIKTVFALARKLTDQVLDVFRVVSESVDALNAIADYQGMNEADYRQKFRQWEVGMNVGLYYIWRVANFWRDVGLSHAKAFAEAVSGVFGIISEAIDALNAIVGFKGANENVLRSQFGKWEVGMNVAVYYIWRVARFWQNTALDGAVAFVESAEKVLGIVSTGIAAIEAIVEFKPVGNLRQKAEAFGRNIIDIMDTLNRALGSLGIQPAQGQGGPPIPLTPEQIKTKFAGLAAFAEAVEAGVGFITPAIDAILSIGAFKAPENLYAAAQSFNMQIMLLMQALNSSLTWLVNTPMGAGGPTRMPTPEEVRAKFSALAEFSEAVQAGISFIAPVIEAMTSISAYKEIGELKQKLLTFGIDISKLMQGLVQAVEIVMNSFATGTPYFLTPDEVYEKFEGVRKFSEAVQSVLGFIQPVIDAMDAISGYKPVKDIANKVKALLKDLDEALIWIAQLAGQWIGVTEEGLFSTFFLDKMSLFSTNVQAIIAMIVPVIEALTALAKYATGKDFAKGIEQFKADLDTAMIALADLALNPNLSAENLAALKTFSSNLLGVIADLQSIVDALTAIGGYKAGAAVKAFQAVTTEVGQIVNYLWNSMQMVESETMGIGAADRFETAAKHIADAVARGMARLGELGGYEDEGENGSAFGTWFATQLGIAKTAIEALAQNSAWGNLKDAIDSVIEALKDLFGLIQSPPGGGGNQYRPLITAYEQIGNAASVATGKIKKLNQTIGAVTIPPQLETHSPPPFARGLDYIAEAARRAKEQFADMQNSMRNYSLPSTLMAAQAAAAVSNEVNVNMGGVNINNGMSEALFEARVRRVVKDAMRG